MSRFWRQFMASLRWCVRSGMEAEATWVEISGDSRAVALVVADETVWG